MPAYSFVSEMRMYLQGIDLALAVALSAVSLFMAVQNRYLGDPDRFPWSPRVQGAMFSTVGLACFVGLVASWAGSPQVLPLAIELGLLLVSLIALLRWDPLETLLFGTIGTLRRQDDDDKRPFFLPEQFSDVPLFTSAQIPIPPPELRGLTGRIDVEDYQNLEGKLVYPYLDESHYECVLDFGCGCGRVARQMMLQTQAPENYLGIDLHRDEIDWCRENLKPLRAGIEFLHHDVFNPAINPDPTKPRHLPFPAPDSSFTMVNAISTFTHLVETDAVYYLEECARVLRDGGVLHATWFLFSKDEFPALKRNQNALYGNDQDPTDTVYFDREWLLAQATRCGLSMTQAILPDVRGFQWTLVMRKDHRGQHAELPADTAPVAASPIW
jgi:SAM-dependent methyltransferase